MAKVKRMTVEQYFFIRKWLELEAKRIEDTELSQLEAASLATGALGFTVPLSSIKKCAKIVGIKWANSPSKPQPVPLDHEAIVILIGAISGLYVETGRTIPNNLANLQSQYVKKNESHCSDELVR